MSSLGDFFPKEIRANYSERSLEIGTVIRCPVDDIDNPKEKFWVILGFNEERGELLSIYVNTQPAPFIQRNPTLLKAQLLLRDAGRNIFDYDCYADCCHPKVKIINNIQNLLNDNPKYVKGKLAPEEMREILMHIREATNVAVIIKKRFGIIK